METNTIQVNNLVNKEHIEVCCKKGETVGDLLKNIGLDGKFFAVLINNCAADLTTSLENVHSITILPKIAGG